MECQNALWIVVVTAATVLSLPSPPKISFRMKNKHLFHSPSNWKIKFMACVCGCVFLPHTCTHITSYTPLCGNWKWFGMTFFPFRCLSFAVEQLKCWYEWPQTFMLMPKNRVCVCHRVCTKSLLFIYYHHFAREYCENKCSERRIRGDMWHCGTSWTASDECVMMMMKLGQILIL